MTKRSRDEPSVKRLQSLFKVPMTTEGKGAKEHYQAVLGSICHELMLDYDLVINRSTTPKRYALLEVEAYFKTDPIYHHDDPFTHAHPLQYQNGVWFFHHVGHGSGYRGGSRKGMDVTLIGDKPSGGGGLLIRAVQCRSTGKIIEGPSLVVDLILAGVGASNLKSLTADYFDKPDAQPCWEGTHLTFAPQQAQHKKEPMVLSSCRIGLGLKNRTPTVEKRLNFVCRPYRFVMHPRLLQKGKVWTLLEMIRVGKGVDLDVKDKLVESCRDDMAYGREHAVALIQSCYSKSPNDLVSGGLPWKIQLMSAILWWDEQVANGKHIDLGVA